MVSRTSQLGDAEESATPASGQLGRKRLAVAAWRWGGGGVEEEARADDAFVQRPLIHFAAQMMSTMMADPAVPVPAAFHEQELEFCCTHPQKLIVGSTGSLGFGFWGARAAADSGVASDGGLAVKL